MEAEEWTDEQAEMMRADTKQTGLSRVDDKAPRIVKTGEY